MIVKNIEDYIRELPHLNEEMKTGFFYRGDSDQGNRLVPSVFRGDAKGIEDKIYLKVLAECSNEFDLNSYHIDVISKMQHYGVPTRLLDVTTNALVALYFACKDNGDKDGYVYVFNPDERYIKQFDSDTISILASIPRFNEQIKRQIYEEAKKCCNKTNENTEELIKEFNNKSVVKRLLHEIKKEKPSFENIINPNDLLTDYFVFPKKDNPRIIRQSGAFIIFGLHYTEENINKIAADKIIVISHEAKENILKQLKCFGITKATLFPELYKVAEYIKECIKNKSDF